MLFCLSLSPPPSLSQNPVNLPPLQEIWPRINIVPPDGDCRIGRQSVLQAVADVGRHEVEGPREGEGSLFLANQGCGGRNYRPGVQSSC